MRISLIALLLLSLAWAEDTPLPAGVKAVWNPEKAFREKTETRERVCLNGLWRWQPAAEGDDAVPAAKWGFFKVPGCWPGSTDYMQKDCQTVFAHPEWKNQKIRELTNAWYQREFTVPPDWAGKRIALSVDQLNSFAVVFIDGKKAGEIRFPGGELELTAHCPAGPHVLSMHVSALPLKAVMLSYTDTATARTVKGSVERRGLCGDVFLAATPPTRIADVKVETSSRKSEITLSVAALQLAPGTRYKLKAIILESGRTVKEFCGELFDSANLVDGRMGLTERWKPERLWDIHAPKNQYDVAVSLLDAVGKLIDAALPARFGFREFWIDGRDFYLNGTRLHLSAMPIDNAQVSAGACTYAAVTETLARMNSYGINFVYTHNYGCDPGSHLAFNELLRACDDAGVLVSFSQPHFSHYDWKAPDADAANGYARQAEYYVHVAQNHPSVVFYSMSHNATGYTGDMDPELIDGISDPRDTWSRNNVKSAMRAEAIVRKLDPSRIVYHHASGNLGPMWNCNFYPNFVPIQELSDWFEHWSTAGQKPAFTCEYGAPFTWDWSMYRGWYKGQRAFGSAAVQWEFCFAEWNSQFLGDSAFKLSEYEKANLRYEAKQFRAGGVWHRWDYPNEIGSNKFDDRHTVLGRYTSDNWRAFRTWGLSANSPWECGAFWRLRDGVERNKRVELPVDWENLQRPGFSPDYIEGRYERFETAYERNDWIATASAQALIRNNQPLLGYIAGKPAAFTSKDHNFEAGEAVEKQLIVINDTREKVSCNCTWALRKSDADPGRIEEMGENAIDVASGDQARVPVRIDIPKRLPPGKYTLSAGFKFSTGVKQGDWFDLFVMPPHAPKKVEVNIALFDPKGETAKMLQELGVQVKRVDADGDLRAFDMLIIGKGALTPTSAGLNLDLERGLKVIVFEQDSATLEQRFGFRVAEYGLRNVFVRVPDHPLVEGLSDDNLRDWRGSATLLPPKLKLVNNPRLNGTPTIKWCGIDVTRLWRCGNRGNVASVLIEKPARGDFLPILDGGFSLQYSPLMEYRESNGMILFCQMDVTGRSESDPAAAKLASNILSYTAAWKPAPRRMVFYAGDPVGAQFMKKQGFDFRGYDGIGFDDGGKLADAAILIAGPASDAILAPHKNEFEKFIKNGGHILALGLDETAANAFLPIKITTKRIEHISAYFNAPRFGSAFAGISSADVHNRDPRPLALITGGATVLGDGVLAQAENGHVVFCQRLPWTYDYSKQYNLKRTFRRSAFLINRILENMGAKAMTPIVERFKTSVDPNKKEQRWLNGLYLDEPEEMDDPYRAFRW